MPHGKSQHKFDLWKSEQNNNDLEPHGPPIMINQVSHLRIVVALKPFGEARVI